MKILTIKTFEKYLNIFLETFEDWQDNEFIK